MVCWISQWGLRVWLSGHHCHLVTTWSWITVCCQLSGPGVGHVKVKIPIVIHRFCCHTRAWMLCKKNQCTVGKQSGEKPDQSMFSNQSVTFGVVKSDSSVDLKPGAIVFSDNFQSFCSQKVCCYSINHLGFCVLQLCSFAVTIT